MSNQWTNEQLSAITARGSNLLVAAAAGSGKTAVLVERIIRLITADKVDIDSLLVVTFTNAAASEMRERIGEAIIRALEENPLDRNLERQLALLNRSSITTIHSFCLEIIRNNFHLIDLDPGFRIADDTEASILREEALEEVLENAYEGGDAGFLALVESYGGKKDDSQLKEIVLGLYRFVMSDPWPEKWLVAKAEAYNIGDGRLQDMEMYRMALREIRDNASGYVGTMEEALGLIEDTPELAGYLNAFTEDLEDMRILVRALEEGAEYAELKAILDAKAWSRLGSVKKGGDKALAEEAKGIREDLKKFMKEIRTKYFNESEEDTLGMIRALYPLMKSLSGTTTDFIHEYDRRKRERGLLDFSDLEHLALQILTVEDEDGNVVASPAAMKYREKFHEVLVDEYQDSNEVQEVLISMVSRKEGDTPNVFMVGDVKQSIYRFRQAKPELFLAKYKSYDKEEGGHDRKILLYKNFRSKRNILDGVNLIFKGIMSSYVGELDYTDEESLIYGAEYYDQKESTEEPIELLLLESNGQDGSGEDEESGEGNGQENGQENGQDGNDSGRVDLTDYKAIELEARMVALKIREIVQGKEGMKVYDRSLGDYRRISYRDIVVLMRATSASAPVFLAEFTDMEIPCFSDNNAGYFESTEVRTMVSLLKVIDNPLQDVPLISVLRSPVFSFSEEDLAQIRILDKEEFLYNNIVACANDPEGKGAIHLKAVSFRDRMTVYRDLSLHMKLDEFIWYLFTDTSYFDFAGAMPNGIQRQANLRVLFQRARQFEETSIKGLFNFISYVDKLKRTTGDIGAAKILGESEDLVRIMSIHKSKGLEFPVVFLSNAGKRFNRMDMNRTIVFHEKLGYGPSYIDTDRNVVSSTLIKEVIKNRMNLESLSEEMRVLYVALTRAKEKLYITGNVKDMEKSFKKWNGLSQGITVKIPEDKVLKAGSYLDWIMAVLLKHSGFAEKRTDAKVYSIKEEGRFAISVVDRTVLAEKEEAVRTPEDYVLTLGSLKAPQSAFEVNRRLSFVYRYEDEVATPSKVTVSELKRGAMQVETENEGVKLFEDSLSLRPSFLMEKTGMTGAERGTAFHKVMQHLDLSRVTLEGIRQQLTELVERELLRKEEAEAVNPYKVRGLFETAIGKRMLDAEGQGTVKREMPFFLNIGDSNAMVVGVIDNFFQEKEGLVLLDYKTDRVPEADYADVLRERYTEQMRYYKKALEQITNLPVNEIFLYSVAQEKEISITF